MVAFLKDAGTKSVRARGGAATRSAPVAKAPVVPPPQLDSAEADLCDRLRDALAKPPKRVPLPPTTAHDVGIKPGATPAEAVPDVPPVLPFTPLPPSNVDAGDDDASPVRAGPWMQRRRRARIWGAVQASGAWFITLSVVALTSVLALMAAVGVNKTLDLARLAAEKGPATLASAAMAVRAAIGL
jgi:hypothetical protein